jgi:hypothetical protein
LKWKRLFFIFCYFRESLQDKCRRYYSTNFLSKLRIFVLICRHLVYIRIQSALDFGKAHFNPSQEDNLHDDVESLLSDWQILKV